MTVPLLRRCAPALVVVLLGAALAGCSSTMSDAATIEYPSGAGAGTMHVKLTDFENELEELTGSSQFRDLLEQNQLEASESDMNSIVSAVWLGDLVTQTAVDREFAARGLQLAQSDIDKAMQELTKPSQSDSPLLVPNRLTPAVFGSFSKGYQRTLAERRARADKVLASYATPTQAEITNFYNIYKNELACKRVGHILVKTEAEANKVLADLKAGKSFPTLAKELSTDTQSGKNGGDLGCLTDGAFVAAFQTAAESAPDNTPVGPVKTEFGYHVILTRKQVPTLEQMGTQIGQALSQGAAVKEALVTANVRVNPRFGSPGGTSGDQQTGAVVYQIQPPDAPSVATGRDATTTTTAPFAG